ncbi:MAG TPA: DUF308 domain-containing protein [Candidatus Sulfotelmatobacter sp.]|jgi:uncharacterized membrane protein HdeD (DUF308 family)|nr:DUF308 domain-containing protein [Candidatus Sulfotelmatobacter sp.]
MAMPEVEGSRHNWGRSVQLGIALIVLGGSAFITILIANRVPVAVIGWLIVLSAVAEAVHAFRVRRSDGFLFHLVPGVAGVPIGLLIATHPDSGPVTWMLVFASFFTILGLFRVTAAFWLRFPNWGWTALEGVVTLALGSVMWAAWIWLVPWFLAFAVGLSLILRGWSSIMLAVGLRRLSRRHRGEQQRHLRRREQASGFAAN